MDAEMVHLYRLQPISEPLRLDWIHFFRVKLNWRPNIFDLHVGGAMRPQHTITNAST
jgi:hypothetical protein